MAHSGYDTDVFDMDVDCNPASLQCNLDTFSEPDKEQPSSILAAVEEERVPLSELWNTEWDSQVYEINGGQDLFEDLKASLLNLNGHELFVTPLAPLKDELGAQADELDFGIELPSGESLF